MKRGMVAGAAAAALPAEYIALELPDGSIAYGQPDPGGRDGYIIIIHVTQTTDGWQVDSWDASSC